MKKNLLTLLALVCLPAIAQESPEASVGASIGGDGTGKIIVEARGELPKPPVFYTSDVTSNVTVRPKQIDYEVNAKVRILQGDAETLSFHTRGVADVTSVEGATVEAWSVRWGAEKKRYIDIKLKKAEKPVIDHQFKIRMQDKNLKMPSSIQITNFAPAGAKSAGFNQVVALNYAEGVEGRVTKIEGFLPVDARNATPNRFQTSVGGNFVVQLNRSGATPGPVELTEVAITGEIHPDGRSGKFQLKGTAKVSKSNATLTILQGEAAASSVSANPGYRLELKQSGNGNPVYELVFNEPGSYPVQLDFVANVILDKEWKAMNFTVAASAVAPMTLKGIAAESEFRDGTSVVPIRQGENWLGFIPAAGHSTVAWKSTRKVGEGKLFFSTTAKIEATVGAGLFRQNHQIDYKVLQGELAGLTLQIDGPGEVLDVQGANVVGWSVSGQGDPRQLEVKLSQAIKESGQLLVRTQTPLDAFPVRVQGLRLTPEGAVRHSGFVRLMNSGSVRLEPTGLTGLTQLAPEQFPGDALEARQVFVYRFPASDYGFEVAADRIQPEVNVSELVLYQLAETDRVISADIELDIREAPVREWELLIPSDYSVVSVSGASVADYIVGTEAQDGQRTLNVIFGQDVAGRQLISIQMEKNEAAAAGDWVLPRLEFPEAKSVRGDIGIVGAPGFRIVVGETDLLVEKPLSYFPKPVPNLQQAFRIREPGWSATMQIELLEKSVQADVFHLYSLSEGTAYGSVLINYFVTGAPVSEWRITVPEDLGNVDVDGKDYRSHRRLEGEATIVVSLHQPVIGSHTLLVTFEEKMDSDGGQLQAGRVSPQGVQGERGYIQVVSPMQVTTDVTLASDGLLPLDALELPAEFRLLSAAPSLGTWQYTERPFDLNLDVKWNEPGTLVTQVVEFSEVSSRVSPDGELVTNLLYYVKSRGQRALKLQLPKDVRLWAVMVAGQSVSARQSETATLIPLPGATDPNIPVEVRLRLGRPAVDGASPTLALPKISAPVLKTEWRIGGDDKHILVPSGGTVEPPYPVLRPTGFTWVAEWGLTGLFVIALLTLAGVFLCRKPGWLRLAGLILLVAATVFAIVSAIEADNDRGSPSGLQLSLPALSPDEEIRLGVRSIPLWQANLSWLGIAVGLAGLFCAVRSFMIKDNRQRFYFRAGGALLISLGLLLQRDGASLFFSVLAAVIVLLLILPRARDWFNDMRDCCRDFFSARKERKQKKQKRAEKKKDEGGPAEGAATASILIGALAVLSGGMGTAGAQAVIPEGFGAANEIRQEWQLRHEENRLHGSGTVKLSGKPGTTFLLLKAPAVLTKFEGEGLRLTRQEVAGHGLSYIVSIPKPAGPPKPAEDPDADPFAPPRPVAAPAPKAPAVLEASFEFQLEVKNLTAGFPLPTGPAAVQEIKASYDRAGWEFVSPAAVKIDPVPAADAGEKSEATLLLAPRQKAVVALKPKARDVTMEDTQFFVETSNLYLPGPGVVDGRHRIHVRPSQGQVESLAVQVPAGLTVSEVSGPIGSWQFDADSGMLRVSIEPAQSATFNLLVDTQRGLEPLPTDVTLSPVTVDDAAGEVGTVALAFGPDAQPEKVESDTMSVVNLGDFDAALLPNEQAVLHRVYRYGAEGGELALRVAPVAAEVRVTSKQVISLGDERIVLGINFAAEITRAGLFSLSFPLPEGLEVESLTGAALHHWAELTENDQRQIILHLNGKTIGPQSFSLTLTGAAPSDAGDWEIPRFELNESTRQTGDLVVKPTTGIRLGTVSRQNISEVDPRTLGGEAQGALAFRLLQRDWNLVLNIEKLDPWVTGQVLQEVTLREGQTRSALMGNFNVQNASIRALQVRLPVSSEDEIKTLRASGKVVSDLVRSAADSEIWEIQFKRRVVGNVQVRIEFERRGDRVDEKEILSLAVFPEARSMSYYFAVRAGGRLELEPAEMTRGWQLADWTAVPQNLREAGNRSAPALTLRAVVPELPLEIQVRRHSLAEALKLRVAGGALTTVLSPLGDQLTSVDLTMEVVQRSSLRVGLPKEGELFNIFVNGESVNSIRDGDVWQFHILPGANDRTASVRFVYAVPGKRLGKLNLTSPQLNVPLENIRWRVVAPKGFELTGDDGNLELESQEYWQDFDRSSYLAKAQGKRQAQAQQAAQLLETANQLLQAGEQTKARWALNSVANQYALDAASNEDARVQLENLQTQQAIVGLNTRRQRLVLDNTIDEAGLVESEQIKQGAAVNPVLQEGNLKYRPQELSQLLQGNTSEDNATLQRIAGRLVRHQRSTEPAPQAITITLPEESTVYTFTRTVQVAENAPLELTLWFDPVHRLGFFKAALVVVLLVLLAGGIVLATRRVRVRDENEPEQAG